MSDTPPSKESSPNRGEAAEKVAASLMTEYRSLVSSGPASAVPVDAGEPVVGGIRPGPGTGHEPGPGRERTPATER